MTQSDIDDRDERTEAMPENEQTATEQQPDELTRLQTEHAEMRDRVLRTLAEMENLRKRTEREVSDAKAYAVSTFARDLLSVADNLDRALSAVPPDDEDPALKSLVEGVAMTGRELQSTLAKHGVTKIEPAPGEKFDPNLHQAMFEVPDPNQPSGSVVQVVVPGFAISGRLLRPAMVGVSKGGPKAAANGEGAGIDKSA
jgi:molecular chaperone GrpE